MASDFDTGQITELYFARIHRAALILSGNAWEADDLAQETFLVLSRQLNAFRGQSSVYTWLYGILLNLERSRRRRSARQHKLRVLWKNESISSHKLPATECELESAEWKRSLWSRVAELSHGQRHALTLRFSEQLHYEEIAEILQCPLGTVKSRIFHGLAALREKMQHEFSGPIDSLPQINKQASHVG